MALTLKHRNDGSCYPVGDTQGLMVPLSLPTDYAEYTVPVGFGGAGNIEYTPSRWTVPEDGDWLLTMAAGFNNNANVNSVVFFVNGAISYIPIFADGQNTNKHGTVTWLRRCTAGEVLSVGFQLSAAIGVGGGCIFNKIKLNALSPYIIANKGALVSSNDPGKVAIDPDSGIMSVNNGLLRISANTLGVPFTDQSTANTNPVYAPNTLILTINLLSRMATLNGWVVIGANFTGGGQLPIFSIPNQYLLLNSVSPNTIFIPVIHKPSISVAACYCDNPSSSVGDTPILFTFPAFSASANAQIYFDTTWSF
jgi:hypothetical protein